MAAVAHPFTCVDGSWKLIHELKAAPKVKSRAWRFCPDVMPFTVKIGIGYTDVDPIYPFPLLQRTCPQEHIIFCNV